MLRYYTPSLRIGPKASIRLSSISPFTYVPPPDWFETNEKQILFCGTGNSPYSFWNGIQKTTYSNDTNALVSGQTVSQGRAWAVGVGNNQYGYNIGGYNGGTKYKNVDKYTYSSDTVASNIAQIADQRDAQGASGNLSAGYATGGRDGAGAATTTCSKINFSTDVVSGLTGGALSTAKYGHGCASSTTALYSGPGYNELRKTDKMPFSTETNAYLSGADVASDKKEYTPIGDFTALYMLAGSNLLTSIMKLAYSTDTSTTLGVTTTGTNGSMGSQGISHGYMVGGYTSNYTAAAHKFTFSTETIAAASSANSVGAMLYIAACG